MGDQQALESQEAARLERYQCAIFSLLFYATRVYLHAQTRVDWKQSPGCDPQTVPVGRGVGGSETIIV
jgi:hypothetical protein